MSEKDNFYIDLSETAPPVTQVKVIPTPRHEIQFKPGGTAGLALKAMRDRGWAMLTRMQPMTSQLEEDRTTFTIDFEIELYKLGQRMSKATWDSELLEVCRELGIAEANSNKAI